MENDDMEGDYSFEESFLESSQESSLFLCKDFHESLVEFLNDSKKYERFTDVMLMSQEGLYVKAHRLILSAASTYFQTIFRELPPEVDYPVIILKEIEYSDLLAIVDVIYRGKICVGNDRIDKVKEVAELLRIKGFVEGDASHDAKEKEEKKSSPKTITSAPVVVPPTPSPPESPVLSYSKSLQVKAEVQTKLVAVTHTEPIEDSSDDIDDEDDFVVIRKVSPRNNMKPPAPPVGKQSKRCITPEPSSSRDTSMEESSPSLLSTKPKKDSWVDLDRIGAGSKRSLQTSSRKSFKQTSILHSMLFANKTTTKVDLSKTKEFKGGLRNSSQSQGKQTTELDGKLRLNMQSTAKRKSDEAIEGTIKREKANTSSHDMSTTMYDLSPIKIEPSDSPVMSPMSPVRKAHDTLPRKPLSPGKQNIVEKPTTTRTKHETQTDTMMILKDFDAIPKYASKKGQTSQRPEPKKEKSPPAACICLKKDKNGYIPSKYEQDRIRRRCPVHKYDDEDDVPLLDCATPDNYWCTPLHSTQELYENGRIQVATPFTPPTAKSGRRPRREDAQNSENQY